MSICLPQKGKATAAPKFDALVISGRFWNRGFRWLAAVTVVCSAVAVAKMVMAKPVDRELITIEKAPFKVELTMRGALEPVRTERVISKCRWTVRILSLIPEGTWVQKGDVVCVLDSSAIEDFRRTREVSLFKSTAALETANQQEQLLSVKNERRLSDARNELQAAEMDLMAYSEGSYPNEVEQLEKDIVFNRDRLRTADDDLMFVERMWSLGYANTPAVVAESHKVTAQSEQVRRLEFQKNHLEEFAHPRCDIELKHRLSNSRLNLVRTELANSLGVLRAKLATLSEQRRLAIYERYARTARESIEACTIRAPRDGQVMYCNNWNMRSHGIRSIEEGKKVYFSQPIFEIPNEEHLKISLPLNEALITSVSLGSPVTVRLAEFASLDVRAQVTRISQYPVVRNYFAPDLKEYILDAVLEPRDDQTKFLRSRMEADATLTLFEKRDAISVPEEAITRCAGHSVALIRIGDQYLPCQVQPGEVSDGRVLIESGLREGDQIVALINEEQKKMLADQPTP